MLRGNHAGNSLKQFGDAEKGANEKVGTANGAFACRDSDAELFLSATEDDDFFELSECR